MCFERLGQSDFEDLCAYLDGQLDGARAEQISRLVVRDAAWREAYEQLLSLDAAMDAYEAPPAPSGLSEKIIRAAREITPAAGLWARVIRLAGPLAAAAAVLVAVALMRPGGAPPADKHPGVADARPALREVHPHYRQDVEDLVADNLDFFSDYDVVSNFETLQAIDRLESSGT